MILVWALDFQWRMYVSELSSYFNFHGETKMALLKIFKQNIHPSYTPILNTYHFPCPSCHAAFAQAS